MHEIIRKRLITHVSGLQDEIDKLRTQQGKARVQAEKFSYIVNKFMSFKEIHSIDDYSIDVTQDLSSLQLVFNHGGSDLIKKGAETTFKFNHGMDLEDPSYGVIDFA